MLTTLFLFRVDHSITTQNSHAKHQFAENHCCFALFSKRVVSANKDDKIMALFGWIFLKKKKTRTARGSDYSPAVDRAIRAERQISN